jgi:hypothetical protein
LLDRAVDTIRGIVEIEQAEINKRKEAIDKIRDAKLQNTIQSVGLGVGVGAGVAGIFSQSFTLIKAISIPFDSASFSLTSSLIYFLNT